MNKYIVTYSARRNGAIGVFYPVKHTCLADTEDSAKAKAFEELHAQGYETQWPLGVALIEPTDEMPEEYYLQEHSDSDGPYLREESN
jgi:hypothetical protein